MSTSVSAQSMTSQGAGGGDIPDLVKIGTIPTDTAIDVTTEILEPVSFSQNECRFVLSNKGILHSNSRITLALDGTVFNPGGVTPGKNAFLPINVGIASLLQRVRLTIGGKTVSELENFGDYMAYESTFISPEQNKEREQVFTSRVGLGVRPSLNERQIIYASAGNANPIVAGNDESNTCAGQICIDNGTDFNYHCTAVNQVLPSNTVPTPTRGIKSWQADHRKGVFSILIADLFPFLKMNQLPLFMLSEQVMIHLTFTPQVTGQLGGLMGGEAGSKRICSTLDRVAAPPVRGDRDASITRQDVSMVADYIFYPQEMMLQYQQSNANMNFSYIDYQFVQRTVPEATFTSQLIQNVGGAGRICNKVCVQVVNKTPTDRSLINNYGSDGPLVTAAGNGLVSTNIRYNDLFLFPIDVTNSARHFHNILMTEGRMPHTTRDFYSGQGQLAKEASYGGFERYPMGSAYDGATSPLDCDVRSRAQWYCYRLNRNERVNSRGIEVYDRRTTMAGASTFRAWIQVVRMAQLVDGKMDVSYA